MVYDADLFNKEPYYDDFDDNKKFLRMLFRPGYAVQARELTQLQTLLSSQVQRFGDHIFEDGSIVSGGQIAESRVSYARVNTTIEASTDGGTTYSDVDSSTWSTVLATLVGNEATLSTDNEVRAKIVHTMAKNSDTDPYHYIFFNYYSGKTDFAGTNLLLVTDRNTGNIYRLTVKTDVSDSIINLGNATLVTTQPGIYFASGFFVLTSSQKTVPFNTASSSNNSDGGTTVAVGSKMFEQPTSRVGFTKTETIVTSVSDSSLGDPAFGSPNQNAPGADRYKLELVLGSKEFVISSGTTQTVSDIADEDFLEILRVENGVVSKREIYPDYAVLEDSIARRTFDESGNYTIDPFDIDIREHFNDGLNDGVYTEANGGDSSKLALGIEPGRAYVRGYEFENLKTTFIDADKARSTDSQNGILVDYNLGNYFIVGSTTGVANGFTAGATVLHSDDHPTVNFFDNAGLTVASALFRHIQLFNATGNKYKFFFNDIGLSQGADLKSTHVIKNVSGVTVAFIDEDDGKNTSGARIFDSTEDSLLIPLPVNASISDVTLVDHEAQVTFTGTGASSQVVFTAPSLSGDPIIFKNPSAASFNTDLFLINTSTGVFFDDFASITPTVNGSSTELTLDFGAGTYDGDSFTLIANMDIEPGDSSEFVTRSKTLNASQTVSNITLAYSSSLGQTEATLGFADVYVVESILGTNTANDYRDQFVLDDGQRDTIYDHAKLVAIAGASIAVADTQVDVTFRRFTHTGQYGPFTVESYPVGTAISGSTFGYENIPSFTSEKTSKTVSLRDVMDYRPIKNSSGNVENAFIPTTANFLADFEYYLPRIDKVVLRDDKRFAVIKGVPSLDPSIPEDDPSAMTLFILKYGSYTFNPDDIEVRYIDNKRFTMRDIGKIEDRVDQIEFYSNLSLLEQEANSLTFTDTNGAVIPKTGILVDNFNGHEIGDVTNTDYVCAMDFEESLLRPAFTTDTVRFTQSSINSGIKKHVSRADSENSVSGDNNVYTLNYNEVRAVQSILPNTTVNVNPTSNVDWMGTLYITPESDDWYSQAKRPKVKLNKEGANDAWQFRSGNFSDASFGFGTQWKDWEFNWFGIQNIAQEINENTELLSSRKVFDETFAGTSSALRDADHETTLVQRVAGLSINNSSGKKGRESLALRNIPDTNLTTIENRLVNTTVSPYTRNKTIRFYADGMKPNTTLYLFVDNTQVGTVTTDNTGKATGSLNLSTRDYLTGDKFIRLIDNVDNNVSLATTTAEATYKAKGLIRTRRNGVVSTRPDVVRRSAVNDETIDSSVLSRSLVDGSTPRNLDALSQNFTVDRSRFRNGMFTKSLDLLISRIPGSGTNDNDSNVPITVEIRPTVNGYPHPSKVIPGSIKSLLPSEVNASGTNTDINDTNIRTRFDFDYPVYLAPGEYTIVVRSNSDRYLVFVGNMGDTVSLGATSASGTGTENVTRQPFIGSFFKPQNAGTLVADNTQALVFGLNRCEFETSGEVIMRNKSGDISADTKYDLYRLNTAFLDIGSTSASTQSLKFELATTPEGNSEPGAYSEIIANETLRPNRNSTSGRTQTMSRLNETARLRVTLESDDNAISPFIDSERLSMTVVQNLVNESSSETSDTVSPNYNGELEPQIPLTNTKTSFSRYITKPVVLSDSLESTDIRAFLRISKPTGTDIQVFARVLQDNDTLEFVEQNYIELTEKTSSDTTMPRGYVLNRSNTEEDEYVDVEYKLTDSSVFGSFKVYSIKIVLHSNDQFIVPKCKDLRIVTLA